MRWVWWLFCIHSWLFPSGRFTFTLPPRPCFSFHFIRSGWCKQNQLLYLFLVQSNQLPSFFSHKTTEQFPLSIIHLLSKLITWLPIPNQGREGKLIYLWTCASIISCTGGLARRLIVKYIVSSTVHFSSVLPMLPSLHSIINESHRGLEDKWTGMLDAQVV